MKKALNKDTDSGGGIDLFNAFSNRKYIVSIIVIVVILLSFISIDVLKAQDFINGEYLKSWIIRDGDRFTIVYTHSVELTPVSEIYLMKDGQILLIETFFESYGAGLPASTPYKFELTNRGFRIFDINQVLDNLTYRTGAIRANHTLAINNREYEFLDFSKPREGVRFSLDKTSLISYFIREVLK